LDIAGVVVGNRRALNYSDKHVERRAVFTNAGELAALNQFAEQALQCAPGNVRQCIANGIDLHPAGKPPPPHTLPVCSLPASFPGPCAWVMNRANSEEIAPNGWRDLPGDLI